MSKIEIASLRLGKDKNTIKKIQEDKTTTTKIQCDRRGNNFSNQNQLKRHQVGMCLALVKRYCRSFFFIFVYFYYQDK